jgi:hypothetical protein
MQTPTGQGLAFNPATGAWRKIARGPLQPRYLQTAVWTGSVLIVWGGIEIVDANRSRLSEDGAMYDPASDSWTPIPSDPLVGARPGHSAVWDPVGQEMIVWAGTRAALLTTGAAFSPSTRTWRAIAEPAGIAGRIAHAAVLTNRTMTVFGGDGPGGKSLGDAASYDLGADTWAPLPAPPIPAVSVPYGVRGLVRGREVPVFFGGSAGAVLDNNAWTAIPQPPTSALAAGARTNAAVWFGAGRLFVWGGGMAGSVRGDGASFDVVTRAWAPMAAGGPSARYAPSVVWTGKYAIILGGNDGSKVVPDGAIYVP